MAKKAVLIGINYPGTSVELRGCVNDVRRMKRCLIDRFGFSNENITVLIDTDKSCLQPTRKNICDALTTLIASGKSGDFLVVHYSGHGTRKDSGNLGDATGFDECIIPCDLNLILDDEFRNMVAQVKEGCQLTIISDSCHSGGLVEGIKEQIGDSQLKPPKLGIVDYLRSIVMSLLATCGTSRSQRGPGGGPESFNTETELENGETVEKKTRYISVDNYISLLEQQTGITGIEFGNIRPTLVKVFGEDASPKVLSSSIERNGHRGLLGMFLSKREVDAGGTGAPISIPDKGILLSGCQTNQRSEDVYVTRTGEAYGAFSDAIQTILSTTRKEKKITNKEVVLKARVILKEQMFIQQPVRRRGLSISNASSSSRLNGPKLGWSFQLNAWRNLANISNITVLIDTDKSCLQPTRKNIGDALMKLNESGKSGDFLVVHYSGHGTRNFPGRLGDPTGFDECIIPCDLNLISGMTS